MIRMALIGAGLYLAFALAVTWLTLQAPVAVWQHITDRIGGL